MIEIGKSVELVWITVPLILFHMIGVASVIALQFLLCFALEIMLMHHMFESHPYTEHIGRQFL